MIGRMYTVSFNGVSVTAAQDLFSVVAPSTAITVLHGLVLGQSSDAGDAEEELRRIRIRSGQTTAGSGGSAATAVPVREGDTGFGGTVRTNDTTIASAGTIVERHVDVWNVRSQYIWIPTPEMRLGFQPSRRWTVELVDAPADALTVSGTLYFASLG